MFITRSLLISLTLLATQSGVAAADPKLELEGTLAGYAKRTEEFGDYLSQGIEPARFPIHGCSAALAKAREADVTITAEHQQICKSFVAWHQLAEAEAVLTDAQQWNYFLTAIDVATNHEENGAKMAKSAARCSAELDRLILEGMPTDVAIRIGNSQPITITMRVAKAKVCEPLAKAGGSFAKDVSTARQQRHAERAAPYKAVGIKGDRLALLVDHASYAMYAKGGAELTTPKQLKTASVIFELLGPGTDGLYILRRYQFRGDKLVSTTSREFWLRPSANHYR